MDLAGCPLHMDVVVRSVDLPADVRVRMWELGLHEGVVVRATHRGPAGGRVVAVGGSRLALDGATATRVAVAVP